jgi:hypothetical protein
MRVYIAGPMRGIPDLNFPAFDAAAARGRALGHDILNPAELDRDSGFDGKGHSELITPDFMKGAAWRDFVAIVGPRPDTFRAVGKGCDAVAMLPGWERSRGARAEKAIAEWIGLAILDAETFEPLGAEPPVVAKAPPGCYVERLPPAVKDPIKYGDGYTMQDSGKRDQFATGAVRDAAGDKGFFHCIPYLPVERLAKLYEAGSRKYSKDNWRKGIPLSRFLDSAIRHLLKIADGWADEDHAAAVLWNVCGYIWTANEIAAGRLPKELADDRLSATTKEAA